MNDTYEQLDEKTRQLLRAIDLCLDSDLWEPALILIYAGVDAFAWLDLPKGQDEATGADFARWAKTYLLPDSGLDCSAEKLWGARCGLLHTHTSESKLYRKGAVRRLEYSRRRAAAGGGKPALVALGVAECVPAVNVDLDELVAAFQRAIDRFNELIANDSAKREILDVSSIRRSFAWRKLDRVVRFTSASAAT